MYRVVIQADEPAETTADAIRSRMGLLNQAMARVIADADDYCVMDADYVSGRLTLNVWTSRIRGIRQARVHVSVDRVTEPLAT